VLLAGVPLVDVVMLVASVIDLHNGAAHLLAGAPRPAKLPKGGRACGGFEKSGVLMQPAVTWTIVLVIDALVSFSYSLDRKSEHKQPV
jgi:hypothetical protein